MNAQDKDFLEFDFPLLGCVIWWFNCPTIFQHSTFYETFVSTMSYKVIWQEHIIMY